MSQAFNLTAQINLQAPSNLKTVVAQIRRELGTVSADVKINISGQSARNIDNITRRLEAMNASLIQARNNTSSLDSALKSLNASLGSIQSASSKTTSGLTNTSTTVKQTAKNIQLATTEMEEFGKQSALAIRRFAAFSVVTSGVFALTNAVTSGFKAFVEFDKELVKLQQVTGKGSVGLRGLEKEITNLATSLGVSSKSLVEVASTLAQAGLSAEDTRVALSALAKTELAPSFDNLTDTTEGAIAALRQFGLQAKDLEKALGSINAVAAAFAVESKDIIAAIQRTGGVFAASSRGVSEGTDALNEFVAVFTSVRATTRESAETIATGLRTIFTRIQRAKTIDQLKEFGVQLTDLEGKFVGPFEAVKRLSQALSQLDPRDLRFSAIVEELGGFRQIGKVIPLIQQFATAQEALKVAQKGQGSLTEAQITAQKSLANQLAKVREQFLALIRDIGKSQTFQGLFKVVTGLASGLISLASAFKPILPILAIMGAVKGVSAITQFASGFAGGIKRGGGAGAVGSNIGESISGAKDKEKSDIQQKANTLISENTNAIKTLTTAMNSLISNIAENTRTLASSNSQTLNSGGVVRKFARGGLVPGSGNSDTVPAMLQPGEFVIRKKAVDTLGASNLHRMNKYASGGTVKRFKEGSIVEASKNTQEAHFGSQVNLSPQDIKKAFLSTRDKKLAFAISDALGDRPSSQTGLVDSIQQFIQELDGKDLSELGKMINLEAKKSLKLKIPASFNQALRRGNPDLVGKQSLIDWINNNAQTTASLPPTLKSKISNKNIAQRISGITPAKPNKYGVPAYDVDDELSPVGDEITKEYALNSIDLMFSGASTDFIKRLGLNTARRRAQDRVTGIKLNRGGFIQRFAEGGVATDQESLLQKIEQLGGIKGVKSALGLSGGDRTADSILRASNIKSGRNLPQAKELVQRALAKLQQDGIIRAQEIDKATKVGIVGLQPFDRSDEEGPLQLGAKNVMLYIRGLSSKFSEAVSKMRDSVSSSVRGFAENLQDQSIFGDNKPLRLDFDETLVNGADIFDSNGNIDIAGYSDLDRVKENLQKGSLTQLGQKVKQLLQIDPKFIDRISVLTARPQSNAKLLSERLNQLGLPIAASKIVGTSGGGAAKANQLKETERLIDDNITNILAAQSQGKDAYNYGEIRDLSGQEKFATGFANIEGAVLEATLAALGAKPGSIQNRSIDYPDGLGRAAQLFPGIDPSWPTEVKRTLDGNSISRAKEEFSSFFSEPSKFKLGGQVYDLQKGSGLSSGEFDEIVKFGNTNNFSMDEFKTYLAKRIEQKKSKAGLMMNPASLLRAITPEAPRASSSQMDLARSLMGAPDAKYNPKYDNAIRKASGGSVEDTVPALLTPGEFVINKKAAQKIGYGKLNKMNKADKIQGFNKGGAVGSIQRFAEGGEVSGVSEKSLQLILRVLVAQEKNSRTSSGQKLIDQIEETIANQSNGVIQAKDAIVQIATGLRSFAIENKRAGNDDRADSLKNIFDALDRLQQSRGGNTSLLSVTNQTLGINNTKPQVDQFSAFRSAQSGPSPDTMGPRSPFPDDLMALSTAAKVAAEEQIKAAEQAEYFAAKAKESGQSLNGFAKTLASKVVSKANNLVSELPGKKADVRMSAIGLRGKINSDEEVNNAISTFSSKLQAIDLDADPDKIKAAAKAIAEGIKVGASFDKIIASSTELKEILDKQYDSTQATEKAFASLAEETGIASDQLEKLVGKDNLRRQGFIQSEQGQRFGKLAQIAPDAVQRFAGTRVGGALGKAADFASGKSLVASVSKKFGDDIGKSLDKWLGRFGGPMGVLGAGLAVLGDQLPKVIESFGMGSSTTAAGIAGGIKGAGQGLASGAVLGAQVAGPIGALIGGVTGAIVSGISGAFEAYNDKRLENNLRALDKASSDLEIAFKKLDASATQVNFQEAQAKFGATITSIADVAQQANLGASGIGRGITETLRGLDPTGLISSLTGEKQEGESRKSTVDAISKAIGDADRLGSSRLNKTSTESITGFLDSTKGLDKPERELAMARANQGYQALKDAGMGEESIFLSRGVAAQQQSGKTADEISRDMGDPKKRAELIQKGKELFAVEGEIALKQAILTRTSKDLAVATEQLLDVYRRAQAGLEKYGQELAQFETDSLSRINDLTGNASIKAPNRANERVLGNISAYSMDEVKRVADETSRLAGGGDSGEKLKNDIITSKILKDELPKALRGASSNNVDDVLDNLDKAFQNAGVDFSDAVRTQLSDSLKTKTEGRQNVGLSDLADDASILDNLLKGTEAGLKFAQDIQAKYNDTIAVASNLMNKYNDVLGQAEEYQRKAVNTRLNAELDLAKALGRSPTLKELNRPADAEVKSLTSGLVAGGTTDPKIIAAQMTAAQQAVQDSESRLANPTLQTYGVQSQAQLDEAIKKDIQALGKQKKALNDGTKALEKLANDGTKAANALSKIQSRQQTSQNAVNIAEKLLTSDETELADFTRQMQAYTKTIAGQASGQELGSLQFRKDAFAGLGNIKSVLPDNIAKQMQATLTRQMLSANPAGAQILQQNVGVDEEGNAITLDQALSNVEGGQLDPVQQKQIEAYNQAVQAQVDAANLLGDKTLEAANVLQADISKLMGDLANGVQGMVAQLQNILPQAQADAQGDPKPEVEAEKPTDALAAGAAGPGTVTIPGFDEASKSNTSALLASAIAMAELMAAIFALKKVFEMFSSGGGGLRDRLTDMFSGGRRRRRKKRGSKSSKSRSSGSASSSSGTKPRRTKSQKDASKKRASDDAAKKAGLRRKPKGAATATPATKPKTRSKARLGKRRGGGILGNVLSFMGAEAAASMLPENVQDAAYTAMDVTDVALDAKDAAKAAKTVKTGANVVKGVKGGLAAVRTGAGAVGSAAGPLVAANTAYSIVDNAVQAAYDPAAYDANMRAKTDAGLQRAQERETYGQLAGDSLSGGLEGLVDPAGKIVEGVYTTVGAVSDIGGAISDSAKSARLDEKYKATNKYNLTGAQLSNAREEAGYRLELEQAKKSGNNADIAAAYSKINGMNRVKIMSGARKDNWFTEDKDTENYSKAVEDMIAQAKSLKESGIKPIATQEASEPITKTAESANEASTAIATMSKAAIGFATLVGTGLISSSTKSTTTDATTQSTGGSIMDSILGATKGMKSSLPVSSGDIMGTLGKLFGSTKLTDDLNGGIASTGSKPLYMDVLEKIANLLAGKGVVSIANTAPQKQKIDLKDPATRASAQQAASDATSQNPSRIYSSSSLTNTQNSDAYDSIPPETKKYLKELGESERKRIEGLKAKKASGQQLSSQEERALVDDEMFQKVNQGLKQRYGEQPAQTPNGSNSPLVQARTTSSSLDRLSELKDKGKLRVSSQGLPIGRTPEEEQEYRNITDNLPNNRLRILKNKGRLRVGEKGLPVGRSPEEEKEYGNLVATQRTPYQQMQQSRREAYLSRLNPETRARMERKLGISRPSTTEPSVSTGPIPTPVSTQQVTNARTSGTPSNDPATPSSAGTNSIISLDDNSRQFLESFSATLNNFGSYIDKLSAIKIPDSITMKGEHVVDVRISGAAAFEGLKKDFANMIQVEVSNKMAMIWKQTGGKVGEAPTNTVDSNAGSIGQGMA